MNHTKIALALAAMASITLTGCNRIQSAVQAATEPSQQQSAKPAANTPAPEFFVGDSAVTDDGLQVTLNDVKVGNTISNDFDTSKAADGGIYVVVIMRIANTGSKPVSSFFMNSPKLIDANGNEYSLDIEASGVAASVFGDNSKALSDLNPGITTQRVDAFEVSKALFNNSTWRLKFGDVTIHLTPRGNAQPIQQAPASQSPIPNASEQPTQTTATQTSPAVAVAPSAQTEAADCTTLDACVTATLAAAKAQDVETIRHIATVIDGFKKPDVGNKAVAADLNTRALAAIKNKDFASAESLLAQAYKENPHNVEVVANYGFALQKVGKAADAIPILQQSLLIDPRRTSNWVPFADALIDAGRTQDAIAALWLGWQWSGAREKAITFYTSKSQEQDASAQVYASALAWINGGPTPAFN